MGAFLWLKYCIPWSTVKTASNLKQAKVVLAQSCGRNSYADAELYRVGRLVERAARDLDVFEHLADQNFWPGLPNVYMAKQCLTLIRRLNIPAIVQWEIGYSIYRQDEVWFKSNPGKVRCVWPSTKPGVYMSTRDVLEMSAELMRQQEISGPIAVVAHDYHVVRVLLMARKLWGDSVMAVGDSCRFFDRESVQPWTRSFARFIPREVMVRFHHLFKGWV